MISSFSLWEPFTIWLQQQIKHWAKPTNLSLGNGTLLDLSRSRADLVVENALLRQQLFRIYWRLKSKCKQNKAKIPTETIALIRMMAEMPASR